MRSPVRPRLVYKLSLTPSSLSLRLLLKTLVLVSYPIAIYCPDKTPYFTVLLFLADVSETLIKLQEAQLKSGVPMGLDVATGEPMLPEQTGIWDGVRVKKQVIQLGSVLASQLLLVDEVLRAGRGARA